MHRSTRLVIAIILALVVPWHAMAAVAMVGCDPAPAPAHAHHAMTQAAADAGHAMHHEHDDRGAVAKVKCRAGSSCCVAAAPPSTMTSFDASTPSQRFAPAEPVGVDAFLTAGLERPPRTDRA